MKPAIVLSTVALGFALLIASSVWGALFPATLAWTPEKAERMSHVKARLNDLSFILARPNNRMHSGPDPGTLKVEYDALTVEFEQLKADFESATVRPNTIAAVFKWSGISLAILGIIGWYAVKQSA